MFKKYTVTVFLDKDGYTAYYDEFPWISAGGDTKEEAIKELTLAFKAAKVSFSKEKTKKIPFKLVPIFSTK